MTTKNDKISVVIPAYNQPLYLRRALESVVAQSYRPIEVIVADDGSPDPLEHIVQGVAAKAEGEIDFRYTRQPQNKGPMDNFRSAVDLATGRYLVPLAHDNHFLDEEFFLNAVRMMNLYPDCHLSYGNAVYEHSGREALAIPVSVVSNDGWSLLSGRDFIRLYRRGGMDFSQAMVVDHSAALALNAYDPPYVVNGALARRLGFAQDDAFAYVFLLSALGEVALCHQPVCEIGVPSESYSRSDRPWRGTKRRVKFIIFYNISRAHLKGEYAVDVRRMAKAQALEYVEWILDRRMARYYGWHPEFMLLMGVGLVKRAWREMRYALKRAVNVFIPGYFQRTHRR
jgi:glycosyltransferase involved in cell wall biosynthesis